MKLPVRSYDFVFICRGSVQDGLGHLMRTKAVAKALPDPGSARLVVIGDGVAKSLLEDSGLSWELVREEKEVVGRIRQLRPKVIVLDTTYLSDEVFGELRVWGPVVSLSPIFNQQGSVDLSFSRARQSTAVGRQHRAGVEYAVINPDCIRVTESEYVSVANETPFPVAISMGGADAPNRTLAVVSALKDIDVPLLIWVILGEGYSHSYDRLVEAAHSHRKHEIILVKARRSMWRILRGAAVAVLAGGITSYEAAYAGIPGINWVTNPESAALVRDLVEHGAALMIEGDESVLESELASVIRELESDRDKLLLMHHKGKSLIDGQGAYRIAKELVAILDTRLALSPT